MLGMESRLSAVVPGPETPVRLDPLLVKNMPRFDGLSKTASPLPAQLDALKKQPEVHACGLSPSFRIAAKMKVHASAVRRRVTSKGIKDLTTEVEFTHHNRLLLLRTSCRRCWCSAFVLALFGVLLMIIEIESTEFAPDSPTLQIALKSVISISTLFSCFCIIRYYKSAFALQKFLNRLAAEETMLSSGLLWEMLCMLAVVAFHVPPFVNGTFIVHHVGQDCMPRFSCEPAVESVDVFGVFMFARALLIPRVVQQLLWNRVQTHFLAALNDVSLDVWFSLRTVVKRRPITSLGSAMFISCMITMYSYFVFERPFFHENESHAGSVFWMMVATMTTVGYGDVIAHTHWGRLFLSFLTLSGLILVALMTAVLFDSLEMEEGEEKFSRLCAAEVQKADVRVLAARAIQLFWRIHADQNRGHLILQARRRKARHVLRSAISKYKQLLRLELRDKHRDSVVQDVVEETKVELTDAIKTSSQSLREDLAAVLSEYGRQMSSISTRLGHVETALNLPPQAPTNAATAVLRRNDSLQHLRSGPVAKKPKSQKSA